MQAQKASNMNPQYPSSPITPVDRLVSEHDVPHEEALGRWQELLGQVGRELAEPLTAALERVTTLTTTGRIDRAGLRALRDEVDKARQTGLLCQQISRLASGRIRQSHERVHLTNTVQSVLAYRAREMHGKGIELTQSLLPIEVQMDASMLFGMLNALVDWWLDCAHGMVELRIDTRNWPVRAQLSCAFAHHAPDQVTVSTDDITAHLNNMHWHLLAQTARTLGLIFDRQIDPLKVRLNIEFPGTIHSLLLDEEHTPDHQGFADSVNSKPLAGSHVLVIAGQRDMRLQTREALRSMGLVLDFVSSVRDAIEFCREGLPHAIVFDGALRSPAFERLANDIRQEVPEFVFIELTNEGRSFDISTISATGMARVGKEGIANALPSALVYELSRVM
jgi:CheY-like chemotaxis protein